MTLRERAEAMPGGPEAIAAAVRRRERQRRNPVNRLRHRLHWLRHRQQHAQSCTCRGTGRLR